MAQTQRRAFLILFVLGAPASVGSVYAADPVAAQANAPAAPVDADPFAVLRQDLEKKLAAQQITPAQFNQQLAKINQLKTQQQVDLQQNKGALTGAQKDMYSEMLGQIRTDMQRTPVPLVSTATQNPAVSTGTVVPPAVSTSIAAPR